MKNNMKKIEPRKVVIFGSFRPKEGEPLYKEAYELGYRLGMMGAVVVNGGYGGVMEASSRGAREAGGHTIGITTKIFGIDEPNRWVAEERKCEGITDRIEKMITLGDSFVVMKGGTGTLSELALLWEYVNKKLVPKKNIVCYGDFWKPVISALSKESMIVTIDEPHIKGASCTELVKFAHSVDEAIAMLFEE